MRYCVLARHSGESRPPPAVCRVHSPAHRASDGHATHGANAGALGRPLTCNRKRRSTPACNVDGTYTQHHHQLNKATTTTHTHTQGKKKHAPQQHWHVASRQCDPLQTRERQRDDDCSRPPPARRVQLWTTGRRALELLHVDSTPAVPWWCCV